MAGPPYSFPTPKPSTLAVKKITPIVSQSYTEAPKIVTKIVTTVGTKMTPFVDLGTENDDMDDVDDDVVEPTASLLDMNKMEKLVEESPKSSGFFVLPWIQG